ncbi:MAG: NAD(+)/NADH kinase [Actinomycetota bacterium]
MPGTVAFIANPAAGSDVRRLVAHATVTSDAAKISIVRRAVVAAADAGADRILLAPDRSSLCERAVDGLHLDAQVESLDVRVHGEAGDTRAAAAAAATADVGALMVLGGDGTCRDAVLGWRDAPLLPVSTGTNNVFPRWLEATVAGTAAALVAGGAVSIGEAARRAKIVELGDGTWDEPDLALVDAVLVQGRFTGSRAVWEPHRLRAAVLAIAEAASVGLSAIGGLLHPVGRGDAGGLALGFDADSTKQVRAPIAPGLFADIGISDVRRLADGDVVELIGPGVLALDGERERVLADDQRVTATIRRTGPHVIDVESTLRAAVARGVFTRGR